MNYLCELPEAVETSILRGLREGELLCCSELSRSSFSCVARQDEHWRYHFEKRLRSFANDIIDSITRGTGLTCFERALRGRHLETFKKPCIQSIDITHNISNAVAVVPATRNYGTDLLLLVLHEQGYVSLCSIHGDTLVSEAPPWSNNDHDIHDALDDLSVLPEAALVADDSTDTWTSPHTLKQDLVAPVTASSRSKRLGKGKLKSTKEKYSAGDSKVSPPQTSPSMAPHSRRKPGFLATETITRGVAIASVVGSHWCDKGNIAMNLLYADKWGDVFRGQFLIGIALPHSKNVEDDSLVISESFESCAVERNMISCCAIFGDGRYIVAGMREGGSLVWNVEGVAATPLTGPSAAKLHATRKEGRGPCFRCGQVGHWARSCPTLSEQSSELSPTFSPLVPSLSPPKDKHQGMSTASPPCILASDAGPILAVAGVLVTSSDDIIAPMVLSASATTIIGHMGSDNGKWKRIFSRACLNSPVHSMHPFATSCSCSIWIVTETSIVLVDNVDISDVQKTDFIFGVGSRDLSCSASSTLFLQNHCSMLCGMKDGRILQFSRRTQEGPSTCGSLSTNGKDVLGSSLDISSSKSLIRVNTIGGTTSSKSLAITSLTGDVRLPIVISGDSQGSVKLWDSTTWRCLRTLRYFGHGAVTSLALLVAAPLRGIAVITEKSVHLEWFGHKPLAIAKTSGSSRTCFESKVKRLYAENPGKASTCEDSRGVFSNSRKKDIGYGDATYQHRGAGRKERRDLAARVKGQTQDPTKDSAGRDRTNHSHQWQNRSGVEYEEWEDEEDNSYFDLIDE